MRKKKNTIARTPPAALIKQLNGEVGYGCPVDGCGNPYLEYHHFDPPWNVQKHHDPSGMIALCPVHHRKADGGAYTVNQLREYKKHVAQDVSGRFEWRRNDVIFFDAHNAYYEILAPLVYNGKPVIWINRDANNNILLNIDINITKSGQRVKLIDNVWHSIGNPKSFSCPPSGREINVVYENGDSVYVKFKDVNDLTELKKVCPSDVDTTALMNRCSIRFPITVVEFGVRIKELKVNFNSKMPYPGLTITGAIQYKGPAGFLINDENYDPQNGGATVRALLHVGP